MSFDFKYLCQACVNPMSLTLKPSIHILGGLGLWIFATVMFGTTQNGGNIVLHLDQVRTYALTKVPSSFDTAIGTVRTMLQTNWLPTDESPGTGCLSLNNWTGNAACLTKRSYIVTQIRTAFGCDIYRAPGCNCINQVRTPSPVNTRLDR